MKKNTKNLRWVLALAMGSLLLAGCGRGDPDAMLASAKGYLEKNDTNAAVIQLKNALQKAPDSAEIRFVLGETLFKSGDLVAADVELRKALALQFPDAKIIPLLAEIMTLRGQHAAVIDQYAATALTDPAAVASLKTSLASAYAKQGKRDAAEASLADALTAMPNYLPAQLLSARMKAGRADFDSAFSTVDAALLGHPSSDRAWQLKADLLLYAKADRKGALEGYQKAIALKAGNLEAHAGALSVLLGQKDIKAARTQLDALKKVAPGHPQTKYFEAVLAFENHAYKESREVVQQLLKVAPDNARVLQLAGLLELQARSTLQAEIYLSKSLQMAPAQVLTRRLLVQTYLRSGQPAKALAAIQPLLEKVDADAESLALAAEVYLRTGDNQKAEIYFTRATKANPDDARSRTALALSQLAKGNVEAAFGELQTLSASDKGITADMALINAHLRRGELDAALKATVALEKKQPDKPLAAELRGRLYLAQKNLDMARKSFERALEIDPVYFPAAARLATMDLDEKRPDQAKSRFDKVLAADPKNIQALLSIAQLRMDAGAGKEEVMGLLNSAIKLNPSEPTPRLALIEYQVRNKDSRQALSSAQDAVAALPQSPEVLDMLGRIQQSNGDINQAINSFNKLVGLTPQAPQAYVRLAGAQIANKDNDAAAQSLKRALAIKPDYLPAQRGLIQMDMSAGRAKEAKATIQSVQSQRATDPIGQMFEGDLQISLKNWEGAALAYKAGLEKKGASSELAAKYHTVLRAAKRSDEAERFASKWIKEHPNDAAFFYYLGDVALSTGNYVMAESRYLAVKKLLPDNASAINNLAWIYVKLNKPGALALAEQANKLQPDQPPFLDTLAMVLSAEKQHAKAVEIQKKALVLQPSSPSYRLNLAKIYISGGQKTQAKVELEQLTKLGDKFEGQDEVAKLLKALGT
ncbi:XrtA/PEP-CTERM system TPR-repeat protein PrsT [Roseateles toxinivorans]|uniref:Putative PEP-CTERM system TPR-repeat lipoprotein n=1 Tax=Roseateles toxinivorans TaxID=270368 RepID=A0A4R6QSH7_9BURK|nr:XrtA/PEP-CTERM system TPR-repeat protein PrsT [Roseateles toxinivorans]TDP74590.1 putative PEP-CTERM system TPR-repeat lipoprotein [Roseateles toxinivorans]